MSIGVNGTDLLLYCYESKLVQNRLKINKKKHALLLNFPFLYIDDVLSLYSSKFYVYVLFIQLIELNIKDTRDTVESTL